MHKVYFDSLSFLPEQEEIKNVSYSSLVFIMVISSVCYHLFILFLHFKFLSYHYFNGFCFHILLTFTFFLFKFSSVIICSFIFA